ncbi:MAG: hypothetical protein OFPII_33360 [Osedax symbiont Rs1]|nr:MAG: hypothetical protein OFPII_33360 [Osedax symbiont Rs1]
MTFLKFIIYNGCICLSISAFNVFAVNNTTLYQRIEHQILSDITKIHPNAIVNIAFNIPNTQKKHSKCKSFFLPAIKKISSGGRIALRLRCNKPNWSTYISVKTEIFYPVATALTHIKKGQALTTENISFVKTNIVKKNRGYFTSPEQIFGQEAKRVIQKSKTITPYLLTPPTLIHKGDSVLIQASSGDLRISTLGTALQKGKKGRQIRVKNNRSGKIIRAYVSTAGKVTISP